MYFNTSFKIIDLKVVNNFISNNFFAFKSLLIIFIFLILCYKLILIYVHIISIKCKFFPININFKRV